MQAGDGVKSVASSTNAGLLFRAANIVTGTDAYQGYYVGISAGGDYIQLGKANNN